MKLTIEGILRRLVNSVATQFGSEYVEFHNKSIARTAADIQAYVKQEMRKVVPDELKMERVGNELSLGNMQKCLNNEQWKWWNTCRSSILTAIENYGKEG